MVDNNLYSYLVEGSSGSLDHYGRHSILRSHKPEWGPGHRSHPQQSLRGHRYSLMILKNSKTISIPWGMVRTLPPISHGLSRSNGTTTQWVWFNVLLLFSGCFGDDIKLWKKFSIFHVLIVLQFSFTIQAFHTNLFTKIPPKLVRFSKQHSIVFRSPFPSI